MKRRTTPCRSATIGALVMLAAACTDGATRALHPEASRAGAVKFWESSATTRWNERAAGLLVLRPPPNGQAAAVRVFTYLSIAQHRAVLAAEAREDRSQHPSVSTAVGAASVVVLSALFPLDAVTLEAQFDADLLTPEWPGARHEDAGSGEAIGRQIGAAVVALAATDNYLVQSPGTPPSGPGLWTSTSPVVRALFGARPFFLTSPDQLRPLPPPSFGSAAFLAALAEVRAISDTRTAEQIAIAQFWNTPTGPFTVGALNAIAVGIIRDHHRTEREAARILAYANAATFDSQIACWDAKIAYWFIRPVQADPGITLAIAMPNHPSYPSGHSCLTSAFMAVLADAFPSERERLDGIVQAAGWSRIYGGIHYRFDIEAGQEIGRGAAALALAGTIE
jgi:membrane-associated phospholipid phosphatase